MRNLFALLALVFASVSSWAENDPNFLYRISFQDGFQATRYAKPEHVDSLRPSRPEVVTLNWSADPEADPKDSVLEVDIVNAALAEALKAHESAVLALSSIIIGRKGLWALYTKDGALLAASIEQSLAGKTRLPVRLRSGRDPQWNAIARFLATLETK